MQFGLSEEQVLLQDNVGRFLDDHVPLDRVRAYADGGDDHYGCGNTYYYGCCCGC